MYHNNTDEKLQQLCETNQELNDIIKEYEEENKFLLSQITHEIRNPLTLIYSTLQLIEHKNPDVAQITYWSNLKDDMKDVFSLLDQLSEYNHCDTLSIDNVDLEAMLKDLSVSFQPYMTNKEASLKLSVAPDCKDILCTYPCDKTKMKQVFVNLLKNAVEAVDQHGTIEIACSMTSPSSLVISISNTGTTISDEELERIFLPFVTTKSTGSGLGLPTVKRILLSHNGNINAISSENKTTFRITLPI